MKGFLIGLISFRWEKQGVGAGFTWKLQQLERWIDPVLNSFQLQSYLAEICAAL